MIPGHEVKGRTEILQRFLHGIGPDAEVGIGEFQSRGIHIIFQSDAELFLYIFEHIAQRTGELRFVTLCAGRESEE